MASHPDQPGDHAEEYDPDAEVLPAYDTDDEEALDAGDLVVDDAEADRGHAAYLAVDDLDDSDNGVDGRAL